MTGMTYKGSGVDYAAMDPFKREAQIAGLQTAGNIKRLGFEEVSWSRGESCYLMKAPWGYLGHVEEGLGTKNLVADQLLEQCRVADKISPVCYEGPGICTIAMIVNDEITLGVRPLSVMLHVAVADGGWFKDKRKAQTLIQGFKLGCDQSRAVWGGGETPTLNGQVVPGTVVLNGSATGVIFEEAHLMAPYKIESGDAILLIGSSGIHANGLTLARQIAERTPHGYFTQLSDGQALGEALLTPTLIYSDLIESCQTSGVTPHYAVNITGHGWRKLMRAVEPFVYVIEAIPQPQPIFQFIQERGNVTPEEMYGNYNMGAGFALFTTRKNVDLTKGIATGMGLKVIEAGYIEKRGEEKKVVIEPLGLEFDSSSLQVR